MSFPCSFCFRSSQVACRQLGFLGVTRFYTHGRGTGPTWLDEVDCKGTEKSLLDCKHPGIGVENCGKSNKQHEFFARRKLLNDALKERKKR